MAALTLGSPTHMDQYSNLIEWGAVLTANSLVAIFRGFSFTKYFNID